jgi:predicted DNA-binding transcriptional regulator AlpA
MQNPFEVIEARLSNIENLLLDIKHAPKSVEDLPDDINLDEVCKLTGRRKPWVYKETSRENSDFPCKRLGNRLRFSRKEVLMWMESHTISKQSPSEIASKQLQVSARKKLRI